MSRKREVFKGSLWSPSGGSSTVRTGESGRGGVVPRLEDGRGAPPGPNPQSTAAVHYLFVAAAVHRRVVDDGRAGAPSEAETDAVEPVVAAETVSRVELRVELLDRGVGCAMDVAAARASAEPMPPV